MAAVVEVSSEVVVEVTVEEAETAAGGGETSVMVERVEDGVHREQRRREVLSTSTET